MAGLASGRNERENLPTIPTVPEAREAIRAKLRQAREWGYEMVKHDFSTYDLLGQWGFEMGPAADSSWLVAFRSQPHQRGDHRRPLCAVARSCRRPDPARRMQHDRAPGAGNLRPAAHWRRHERPPMGAYPAHGSECTVVPPAATGHVLHGRRRSGGNDRCDPVGRKPAMARSSGAEWNRDPGLRGAIPTRTGPASGPARSV